MIHKPLLCNLDNRFLSCSDSINFRVKRSSGSFSLSFQVVHLQERAIRKRKENTSHKILRRLFLKKKKFFGEADFLWLAGESGENEAKSAIFLSWFSVVDSADRALLWDKMDVSNCVYLCIFNVFVGIAGLLPVCTTAS